MSGEELEQRVGHIYFQTTRHIMRKPNAQTHRLSMSSGHSESSCCRTHMRSSYLQQYANWAASMVLEQEKQAAEALAALLREEEDKAARAEKRRERKRQDKQVRVC